MKTTVRCKGKNTPWATWCMVLMTLTLIFLMSPQTCFSYVEVRISVNFILDAAGARPTGNYETDADVIDAIAEGNEILSTYESEFRLELVGDIDDVDDGGRFFDDEWTDATWNDVHARATNPDHSAQYHWRTDAINVYINGVDHGPAGISHPNSRMFGISTDAEFVSILHETCHITGMVHTWNSPCQNGDLAEDRERDPWQTWTDIDDYTNEVWGDNFDALSSHQQWRAENTFFNVMCYRPVDRERLAPCQLNNMSEGGDWYAYRGQVWTDLPLYVNPDKTGAQTGNYMTPYHTLPKALDEASVDGRVLVFEGSNTYYLDRTLDARTVLVPRLGTAKIYPESLYKASSTSASANSLDKRERSGDARPSASQEKDQRPTLSTREKFERGFEK